MTLIQLLTLLFLFVLIARGIYHIVKQSWDWALLLFTLALILYTCGNF